MTKQLGLFGHVEDVAPVLPGDWKVRVSTRAKRLAINVHPNGAVEVVAPRRVSAGTVRRFVEEHRDWITKHAEPIAQAANTLPESIHLRAVDQHYNVEYARLTKSEYQVDGSRLIATDGDKARASLQSWLKHTAKTELSGRLSQIADAVGVGFRRSQFRLQRTRWGSCSSTGTISINASVLLLPRPLCDYLLTHEVCHLRHMNHSQRFWNLVERHCPGGRALDRELGSARLDLPGWVYA